MRIVAEFFLVCFLAGCQGGTDTPVDAGVDAGQDAAPDGGDEAGVEVDWMIELDMTAAGEPLPTALLGHYDLSGALYRYDQVPGLITAMTGAGFSEWRVGVGRWEAGTLMLPTLTDGTPCQFPVPEAAAPPGSTDLDLIAARDWFADDGQPVTESDTLNDDRYALGYIRSVLDVTDAFWVEPFVSIDSMPRALAANRDPGRSVDDVPDACSWTFTNRISNTAPADPAVFAAAVEGLVRRVVEGSHGEPGRAVRYWEIWNEPEFCYFWDPLTENTTPCARDDIQERLARFFDTAIVTLLRLQAYREVTPEAAHLRFGFGSFAFAEIAAAAVTALDEAGIPMDFISFHAYSNDPLEVVGKIRLVADAVEASANLKDIELALAEWGPQLNDQPDPQKMDQALHALTVIALGATAGLTRSHRSIFYAFYEGIPFGLVENDARPRPLHRAYQLLAAVVTPGARRLDAEGTPNGELDSGLGAVLAAKDSNGSVRVLFVNRGDAQRTARISLDGVPAVPERVGTFDSPGTEVVYAAPEGDLLPIPARSVVLVEL